MFLDLEISIFRVVLCVSLFQKPTLWSLLDITGAFYEGHGDTHNGNFRGLRPRVR